LAAPRRNLAAVLTGVELDADALLLHFTPRSGLAREITDRVPLSNAGDMEMVWGVGRLLRLFRASRIRAPRDPYALAGNPQQALELARRCVGSIVRLHVQRRLTRVLTVWTETGVHHFRGFMDYVEEPEGLSIMRRGGRNVIQIPKRELVRYETSTEDDYVVAAIESDRA
jgi:hypothetical protein